MDAAIKATWGQIALNGVWALIFVYSLVMSGDRASIAMLALLVVQSIAFYFVIGALTPPKTWVVILYGIWCLFSVVSAITGGLNLPNLLALISGVLATVALYDMSMCMLERRGKTKNEV